MRRDSKSQGDSKNTTRSKFTTRSIFSTAGSYGCIRMFKGILFRHASVFLTHRHAVYQCLKKPPTFFRHARVLFKTRVFAHLRQPLWTVQNQSFSPNPLLCSPVNQRRHDHLYLHGLHPRKTMVLKSPSATTSMFFSIAWCQGGDFQDHGSEGVQSMVQDHGFARVGTMQVQAVP